MGGQPAKKSSQGSGRKGLPWGVLAAPHQHRLVGRPQHRALAGQQAPAEAEDRKQPGPGIAERDEGKNPVRKRVERLD